MADLAWFPFYVGDFLSSRRTRTMTAEQVGIYLLLLCEQWDHGPIPDDMDEVADIARAERSQAEATLRRCFDLTAGGWVNARLEEIRAEQEAKSARLAEAGRRGGVKSGVARRSKPGPSQAEPGLERGQAEARLKPGSSIRREEIREEEKREEAAPAHAEFSAWMGKHAGCLGHLGVLTQKAIWGVWGPNGTQAHDWKGIAPPRQQSILATSILTYAAEGKRGFHRPFFASIITRAIDDAIASDRQAEQQGTEQAMANDIRTAAKAKEEAEIARLNREAELIQTGRDVDSTTLTFKPGAPRGTGLARVQA